MLKKILLFVILLFSIFSVEVICVHNHALVASKGGCLYRNYLGSPVHVERTLVRLAIGVSVTVIAGLAYYALDAPVAPMVAGCTLYTLYGTSLTALGFDEATDRFLRGKCGCSTSNAILYSEPVCALTTFTLSTLTLLAAISQMAHFPE